MEDLDLLTSKSLSFVCASVIQFELLLALLFVNYIFCFCISEALLNHHGLAGEENMPSWPNNGRVFLRQMENSLMVELSFWRKSEAEYVLIPVGLYVYYPMNFNAPWSYYFHWSSYFRYTWCRVLIQVLEWRFGHSSLECKHFHPYICPCVWINWFASLLFFFFFFSMGICPDNFQMPSKQTPGDMSPPFTIQHLNTWDAKSQNL